METEKSFPSALLSPDPETVGLPGTSHCSQHRVGGTFGPAVLPGHHHLPGTAIPSLCLAEGTGPPNPPVCHAVRPEPPQPAPAAPTRSRTQTQGFPHSLFTGSTTAASSLQPCPAAVGPEHPHTHMAPRSAWPHAIKIPFFFLHRHRHTLQPRTRAGQASPGLPLAGALVVYSSGFLAEAAESEPQP